MTFANLISKAGGAGRSDSARGLSRRAFLQTGAGAGGGLMLSFNLSHGGGGAPDAYVPQAFVRIRCAR